MEAKTSSKELPNIRYGDSDFDRYLEHLSDVNKSSESHLSIFLGWYMPHKKKAVNKISEVTEHSVEQIDVNDIVSKSEEETFNNLDELFERSAGTGSILYLTNGDKLCGAYTGFTHSKVKYATPQERYFLDKVRNFDGIVIIDISENDNADKTIRRMAQSIVTFPLPDNTFKRFIWHLKNYSLHGYDIKTKRPEEYAETTDLF